MHNNTQAKMVVNLLRQLATQIEKNPQFIKNISMDFSDEDFHVRKKQTILPPFDVFDIYRTNNQEGLVEKLNSCSLEQLISIVKTSSLDTTGKVRKWKSSQKVRDFILKRVIEKVSKGSVFDS